MEGVGEDEERGAWTNFPCSSFFRDDEDFVFFRGTRYMSWWSRQRGHIGRRSRRRSFVRFCCRQRHSTFIFFHLLADSISSPLFLSVFVTSPIPAYIREISEIDLSLMFCSS